MKTRTGKIARLPKPIREQLNQRLENGEPGTLLVAWLNQLPEVQKIITEQFAGLPIRPQNLSEWRKGGYLDWIRHQLLREQTRWTAEQADDLGLDTTGKSISIAEDIATVMSAELAIHVQTLSAIKNPKQRFQQFRLLSRELSRLRRDDHHAIRTQLRCNQSHSTPEPVEQNSGTGAPPASPSLGAPASCRQQLEIPKNENDSIVSSHPSSFCILPSTLPPEERQRAGALPDAPRNSEASAPRASVPDCGSPLPLSQSETKREHPIPETQTIKNCTSDTAPENIPYNPPLPAVSLPRTSAPIRVNPSRNYYDPRPPLRGRRFLGIEG